jgi:AcrR family transcriptional regulator
MGARADAVAQTREQILEAAMALSEETLTFAIGLADVAARAGVTVRTVLRHFGSRDGLFDAVSGYARERVVGERAVPVGDAALAVRTIVAHYEIRGDHVMRMLEEASVGVGVDGEGRGRRRRGDRSTRRGDAACPTGRRSTAR